MSEIDEFPINTVICGDNIEVMQRWPNECVDAIVTDPPYGIQFMGKKWDYSVPSVECWEECLRLVKPGGYLLSFAGTRTQHRMAVNIENAGFEIRDMIAWVYGSGFPKSLNISKAIDKAAGAERKVVGKGKHPTLADTTKVEEQANAAHGKNTWAREWDISEPATEDAQQWEGWGTALKPAMEPITMARKPFAGTVAKNVLEFGTGAINADGCRVGGADGHGGGRKMSSRGKTLNEFGEYEQGGFDPSRSGRWPANFIHDGSEESVSLLPQTTSGSAVRFFYCAKASKAERGKGSDHPTVKPLALMKYLVRLVCPVGSIVLDPFNGTGTTTLAAQEEGVRFIGIDLDEKYCDRARERIVQKRLL